MSYSFFAVMPANPLPIHDFSTAKLSAPIGALTEISKVPLSTTFVGLLHHVLVTGCISPKSAFP
jgi:hypothetical protein